MVIGRSSDCQIQLEDDGISRRHAKVSQSSEGAIRLIDLASTNGTWFDGARIDSHVRGETATRYPDRESRPSLKFSVPGRPG